MTVGHTLAPLPLNFPQSFLPERRLLARLLPFAATGGAGGKLEIGAKTGIPTGKSTGKVEPMIHYARGMGLVSASKEQGRWQLALTTLGRVVTTEDPYLTETVTLWVLHLLLCRRSSRNRPATGVADPWFALFAEGGLRLGATFEQSALLAFLVERHGDKGYLKALSGLVLRSYLEPSCLAAIHALSVGKSVDGEVYRRHAAPAELSHFPAYAACLFIVWDDLYPGHRQLAVDELFAQSRLLAMLGWGQEMAARWLDWMADQSLLQLDRHTGGVLALRLQDTETVVAGIFDELV